MKWTDTLEIAIALSEAHPEVDPKAIRFTDLFKWVQELEGFDSLEPAEEKEEDLLDKAWGLEATSRLSCQARIAGADLVIEIPKYTINYEREGGGKK